MDLDLSDEQHVEMCNVTEAIEESEKDELDRVFAEGDAYGVGDMLHNVWHTDLRKRTLWQIKLTMVSSLCNVTPSLYQFCYPCCSEWEKKQQVEHGYHQDWKVINLFVI